MENEYSYKLDKFLIKEIKSIKDICILNLS